MVRSLLQAAATAGLVVGSLASSVQKRPNILFILTDDQDWHMESLQHMPLLQKYLINEGTLYSNHFCTVAICCPSRVNLWTGRTAHNTNVTDLFPPYGKLFLVQ
jgi:N-acetylglucosamine-6-sulfatase